MQISQQQLEEIKKNCLFCKIARKEIKSEVIYEDESIMAVLDIMPVNSGHTIIFPKEHYMISPQIPDNVFAKMAILAKTISHALIKIMGYKGVNIFIANGAAAGQRVPHVLMHVIPRMENDSASLYLEPKEIDQKELVKQLKEYLQNVSRVPSNK